MKKLNQDQMKMVQGGEVNILTVKGLNDGIKKNTEVYILGIRIL